MKVGILGSGDVGLKLADGFLSLGHTVKIGTRDTSKENIANWLKKHGSKASAASFEETAAFGEILILATLWAATPDVIKMATTKNFSGKTVIDVTNPLDFTKGMPPTLAIGHTDSAGETVQRLLPQAKVVKAFNTVGNLHFFCPNFPGGPPTMFICGNNIESKKQVTSILTDFGWETLDMGGIESSRLLEPLAMVWILHYFKTNNGNHAFKLLRK